MLSKDLILVNKPYGATPLEVIQALRLSGVLSANEKATYAGRLDPLATGLLLILKGEGVHEKEAYMGLNKTYEIQIVFGVETDTGDLLGIPNAQTAELPDLKKVVSLLESTHEIQYPAYSSKTVDGKALHEYTREGTEVSRPLRAVQYRVIQSTTVDPVASTALKALAQHASSIVNGDFRPDTIKQAWQAIELPQELQCIALTVEVKSGTYMRAIPEILNNAFGVSSVVTKIHRTRVGDFDLEQAIIL